MKSCFSLPHCNWSSAYTFAINEWISGIVSLSLFYIAFEFSKLNILDASIVASVNANIPLGTCEFSKGAKRMRRILLLKYFRSEKPLCEWWGEIMVGIGNGKCFGWIVKRLIDYLKTK